MKFLVVAERTITCRIVVDAADIDAAKRAVWADPTLFNTGDPN